jgi:hypothetical protein
MLELRRLVLLVLSSAFDDVTREKPGGGEIFRGAGGVDFGFGNALTLATAFRDEIGWRLGKSSSSFCGRRSTFSLCSVPAPAAEFLEEGRFPPLKRAAAARAICFFLFLELVSSG